MLKRILDFSIHHRFLVVMLVVGAAAVGVFSLRRLPFSPTSVLRLVGAAAVARSTDQEQNP